MGYKVFDNVVTGIEMERLISDLVRQVVTSSDRLTDRSLRALASCSAQARVIR